jgi:hypothetical protein
MQENALHGWRLSDAKDMRMGGYPAKPRSFAFLSKGALFATGGSHGAVIWPLRPQRPMGKEAAEIGYDESALVTQGGRHADGTTPGWPGPSESTGGLGGELRAKPHRGVRAEEEGAPVSAWRCRDGRPGSPAGD